MHQAPQPYPQQQPYGQPQPPYGQQPYPPQGQYGPTAGPPPKRKRHLFLKLLGGLAGLVVVIVIIVAVASSGSGGTPGATKNGKLAHPKTIATFTGSGSKNTAQFKVGNTWELKYSFNCHNFGQAGNFAALEDNAKDLGGITVNDIAMSKAGSTFAYDDAGTHYLAITSECDWSAKVINGG